LRDPLTVAIGQRAHTCTGSERRRAKTIHRAIPKVMASQRCQDECRQR
jgi:hypothetical protein